jgi:hypothetical protein
VSFGDLGAFLMYLFKSREGKYQKECTRRDEDWELTVHYLEVVSSLYTMPALIA